MVIETSKIRLREFTIEDVNNWMGILADPIAMQYYPWVLDETGTVELIQDEKA